MAHSLVGLTAALAARDDAGDAAQASQYRRRARQVAERLGMTALLQRPVPPADEWTQTRDGEDWLLEAGEEGARLRDGRGLHYLRALLAAPGQEVRALDLVAGGAGLAASGMIPLPAAPPAGTCEPAGVSARYVAARHPAALCLPTRLRSLLGPPAAPPGLLAGCCC